MTFRVFVLVVALCFTSFFAGTVKANELDDLLKGKMTEYVGNCRFDKNDMLVFQDTEDMKIVQCVVGFEPDNEDSKFVLLFLDKKPVVLLEYSMSRKAQKVLWKRGSI